MSTNVTFNSTTYPIPATGELNWGSLSSFLIDVGNNGQTTNFQKVGVRVATSSPVAVNAASDCVVISDLSVAGAVAVTLPAGATKQVFYIVDGKGDAATNNITITPAAGNINGAATYVINVNNGGIGIVYNGTQWTVFSEFTRFSSGTGIIPRNKIAAGSADHVVVNDGSGNLSSEAQLASTRGGTGVSNAGSFTYGSNNITFTTSGVTSLTLPTTGTLATLAGAESLSNKTLVTPLVSGGSIDVNAAGALAIGASVGANNITLGGATSTVVVAGNLTVSGTTTTVDTATLDVEDANITVNNNGNDASSEGAGLRVFRTGTHGSIIYATAAATKFKVGDLGAEVEVVDLSTAQTISGKSISGSTNTITNVSLTTGVTGILPSANGGTGINNAGSFTYGANNITFTTSGVTSLSLPTSGTVLSDTNTVTGITNKTFTAPGITDYIQVAEQGSTPSTPASGFGRIYAKSDNKPYYLDDAGVESSMLGGSGSGSGEVNAVLNPSAATDTTGWTAATNYTVARDTSNSPLSPITSSCFSMLTTTAAAESSTSGIYYSIASLASGLRSKKLKVEFYCVIPATADGVWRLSVYQGTTRLALSTDSSSVTTLPGGFTGKFTAYFDTDTNAAYSVNFSQTTRTNANTLYVTNVIIGPGIQPQGAVVGEWQSFTPTGAFTTNTTYTGRYRRVGQNVELDVTMSFAGAPNSVSSTVNLPSGMTIDTSQLSDGSGAFNKILGTADVYDTSGGDNFLGVVGYSSTTAVALYIARTDGSNARTTNTVTQADPVTIASGDKIHVRTMLPIAEWAGSGTINLAQNDVEYAATSGTWDAASSTTVYGPAGSQMGGTLTGGRAKTVTWQTPTQTTDRIEVQFSTNRVSWFPANFSRIGASETYVNHMIDSGFGAFSGVVCYSPDSATTVVAFGRYANMTNDDTPTGDWPSDAYWRVTKYKSGQAVGFGEAGQNSLGLVKAGQVKGTNTNDSAVTGYVGEHLITAQTGTSLTSGVYTDGNTLTLTAGDWLVWGGAQFNITTSSGTVDCVAFISGTAGNSNTGYHQGATGSRLELKSATASESGLNTPLVRVTSDGTNLYVYATSTTPATYSSTQVIRLKTFTTFGATGVTVDSSLRAQRIR